VIITLGLVEAWYDNTNDIYFNTPPYPLLRSSDGRLELRISNFAKNFQAVQETISLLTSAKPEMKILLTVSPVPLSDTFSGQDIVTANAYSKGVLRAVAQEVADDHDNVDYFPSYEIVMLSNPAVSWMPDRRHVKREQVAHIVAEFEKHYLE
jgi:hypothetical protein